MFGALFKILRPIRLIKRKSLTSGLFGGDRKWLVLGALVFLGGRVKSLLGFGQPEPIYTEELKPGQRLVVAHAESTSRRRRR